MPETLVRFWGSDVEEAVAACPVQVYDEGHNRHVGVAYFPTDDEASRFCDLRRGHGPCIIERGGDIHANVVARVVLKHGYRKFRLTTDYGRGYPESAARYVWESGNYSCDCNRSLFIREQCDPSFPDMGCGEEIELVSIEVVHDKRDLKKWGER